MTAERPGTPGAAWETRLAWGLEHVVPEDGPSPFAWDEPGDGEYRANRRARRAARRAAGRAGVRTARGTQNPSPSPQTGTQDRAN